MRKFILMNFIVLISVVTFIQCHIKKTTSLQSTISKQIDTVNNNYKNIAFQKFGNSVLYIINKTNTYVICYKQNKTSAYNPNNNLQFFVFDLLNNKIIFEDVLYNGSVNWIEPFVIKVISKPEMVKEGTSGKTGYLYNVKNEKVEPFR
ncbi:MAG: hypothetical protein GXO79_11620 [Chlorobi bacterium]|nr:hypothetical protein [Chlorobiota bacterium]